MIEAYKLQRLKVNGEGYEDQIPDTSARTREIYPQGFNSNFRDMISESYDSMRYIGTGKYR